MGSGCTKGSENVYFRCRKKAAMHDERLSSREGAAELLGVSPSTVADYELGNWYFLLSLEIPASSTAALRLQGLPQFPRA